MIAKMNLRTAANNDCLITDGDAEDPYNLDLHIVSIFVLLIVSILGTVISVVTTRVERLRVSPIIINTGKFSVAVVLATGFIHMLPPGMEALTHPCLPDSWNVYSAYAGLFAMLAVLIMQFIEFIAHQHLKSEVQPLLDDTDQQTGSIKTMDIESPVHRNGTVSVISDKSNHLHHHHHHHHHGTAFHDSDKTNKISTYLLEFGIALHSVLIGVTLGTTSESFVALFIALSFHQFFEAIALGAQIARLERISMRSIVFMIIFFVLTTPVGIAIGIAVHSTTYNPDSVASLLVNGILDSISGGILIYVAIVNLITAEMGPTAQSFNSLSKQLKLLYFISLYAGVAAMAVIGRWA